MQYVVARALLDGVVRIADFERDAHFDPCIQALLARTAAFPHPGMADDADAQFSAEVRVTLNDGRVLSRCVDDMVGRGGDHPMSSEELWEKDDCARRALPKQEIMPLFERLETLEKVADIRDITRLGFVTVTDDGRMGSVTGQYQAVATAPFHCRAASARSFRSVDRETRWR